MALKVADRVREDTSTTGTGALTLSGSPDGYRTFSSALSESDNTYYAIEENDQYEVGIGTFSSSVLERSVVLKSSNSNNKIELGGSGAVFITYPADKSVYRDQESQVVVDASGLLFSNATVIKDAKLTEFTDINSSGTPSSSHIMTFDFADQNLLIGDGIGNVASKSVILGDNAGNTTSPNDVVIIGADAATEGASLVNSVFVGSKAGPTRSDISNAPYYSVVMGYNAADEARHESSIIGYKAGINSYSIGSTALGYFAGSGVGDYATSIGYQAGADNTDDYTINIGYQAGYSAGGDDSIWVGRVAGYNSTAAVKSVGLGYAAGQSSSADNSIYLGVSAGVSNTTDNMFFVANNTPASNGSLIKGDLANKRIAIGAADVTLSDTLYVGINSANDVGVTVKAATSQAADLTQWQNSAGSSVASITNSGVMTVYGVYASGAGLQLDNITPAVTNNALYNVGGVLYWNGSEFTGAIDAYTSGNATYASGEALSLTYASGLTATNASNIVEASGALRTDVTSNTTIASYASGDVVSLSYASGLTVTNQTNITTATSTANYASGEAVSLAYASGLTVTNATNISAVTSTANYASGQALSLTYASGLTATNATNITTATNIANYASGDVVSLAYASGLTATNATNITSITSTANYASGEALSLTYASGLTATNQTNISTATAVANYASGQVNITTDGTAEASKSLILDSAKTFTGVKDGVFNEFDSLVKSSGLIVGNSGVVLSSSTPSVTTNTLYNDGGTLKFNGSTVGGGGGDVSTAQLNYVSGIAVYSSGQAIENEGLVAYASGNTANIAFGSNAEGDILYHDGTNFVRLAKGTNNYILKMDGNVPNWEAESSGGDVSAADFNYVSGVANYSSGNTIVNDGLVAYASGQTIENEIDLLYVSGAVAYASGNTIVNDALVAYASGQTIENESDLLYVSGAAAYSSGVVTGGIPNFNVIGVNTGSPEYGVDVTGGGASGVIQASGVKLGASGIVFSDGTTQTVAGALSTVDLTAGDGLTGGGTLASNRTFAVGAGTLIDVQADQVDVDLSEAAAATIAHGDNLIFLDGGATGAASKGSTDDLANLLAGDGLTKSNSVMAVNVDDSTIETDSDAIRVKDNGITLAKMAGLARGKIIYGDSSGDPAALTAGGANTVLTSDGTDVSWGSVPVNSYVSGIAAYSSGVVTGGIANFTNVGINTGSPAYGLDVTGGGANGLIQATGILIGASGIGVGISSPLYPVDVVQHSGVIRASGVHSTISMNVDAATVIFDLDQATTHGVTLGGTRTLALSNVRIGDKFLIRLQQDGTGSRTVNWFDHISWAGGSAPTLTTTAHKADIIGFLTASGTGANYWFDGLVVGQNI